MKQSAFLRKVLAPLENTPLHPQWLVFRNTNKHLRSIGEMCRGTVLDVGAGSGSIRKHIPDQCDYISLDYLETATQWYHTRPDIFGDGQMLPLFDCCMDTVLLLDVLEHIPDPEKALSEIFRVLKPGGTLHMTAPFLYPIHDAPYDYHRWTLHGLKLAAEKLGFLSSDVNGPGNQPLETAVLLANIAIGNTVLSSFKAKSPIALISPLLAAAVPVLNIMAWLFGLLPGISEVSMVYSNRCIWRRPVYTVVPISIPLHRIGRSRCAKE